MAADRTCHRRQPRQRGAVADVHQQHQPHSRIGRLHAGECPFLLHAVRGTWLAPIRRGWIGTGVHPALWQQELCHGEKQATFVIGYKGMLKLLENSGIYAQPRAVYEDDNIKLKLDENGVPTIECPDEVNVDADHSEDMVSDGRRDRYHDRRQSDRRPGIAHDTQWRRGGEFQHRGHAESVRQAVESVGGR